MSDENLPIPTPKGKPILHQRDGQIFADSIEVAAFFEKEHKAVLRAIRELHCSEDFRERNFAPFKINDLSGDSTSHYLMTRDGFMFLAMGFTGAKAALWKESYITAFNAMEEALRKLPEKTPYSWMRAVVDDMETQDKRLFSVEKSVEKIEKAIEVLGAHEDYMTIKQYAGVKGLRLSGKMSSELGKQATMLSRQRDVKTGQQPDATYGHVNTYHRDILDAVFKTLPKQLD